MRLAKHVVVLVWEALRFAYVTRRIGVVAVIVLGLALLALTLTAQAVAPVALYPFA